MSERMDVSELEMINRFVHGFSAPAVTIIFCSFKDYKNKIKKFKQHCLKLMLETRRLDDSLDKWEVGLKERISYFRTEVFKILENGELPEKFYPEIRSLAENVCVDYELLHTKKTKGAMDILRRKSGNSMKACLLFVIAKTFPEVDSDSRRLKLILRLGAFGAIFLSFIDDIFDAREEKETPHLNSFLTAIGYGKS